MKKTFQDERLSKRIALLFHGIGDSMNWSMTIWLKKHRKAAIILTIFTAFIIVSVQYSQVINVTAEPQDSDGDGIIDSMEDEHYYDYYKSDSFQLNAEIGGTRSGEQTYDYHEDNVSSIRPYYKIWVTTSGMQSPPVTLMFKILNSQDQVEYSQPVEATDNGTFYLQQIASVLTI